jgi:predicted SAM-dependent methyltransferase
MSERKSVAQPLRLNIGGTEPREGWRILNIWPGPDVDFVGGCHDLSQFASGSVAEIYASHVLEHLSHNREFVGTLREFHRVLAPRGMLRISVPDMETLCRLFVHPALDTDQRYKVMEMMFGGQLDTHDFHKIGLSWSLLETVLKQAGFTSVRRVPGFDLFANDCSTIRFCGVPISLNVEAVK